MTYLRPLMERNFIEYASYVVVERAIPDLRDGCKPVQRRILQTLSEMDDGKFNKVANVIGETMKLHPHGDASIGSALVVLANKDYFIERQGNFGDVITGHAAAAARYIECRLTELARDTLFNPALTEYGLSYDGRRKEALALPAKLPVALLLGTEGIAVGMSTRILPHNFTELLEAQVKILRKESFKLFPDFAHGGEMDVSDYADGLGKVKVRARLDVENEKKIVIREVPFSTTTESLIASIESAAHKNKVKISSIDDFTTGHVEIELTLPRGVYAAEVVPQLYAYTDCEVSIATNLLLIRDGHPVEIGATDVLRALTQQLKEQIKRELELELANLADRQHWLTLEQIFIEERVYKKIEKATSEDGVKKAVYRGLEPFADYFVRDLTDDDVKRLLDLRIRKISAYDIEKNRNEIEEVEASIKAAQTKLRQLTRTTIRYVEGLLKKYGHLYPRRTELASFASVDKKQVALQHLKMCYNAKTGFIGTAVKGKDIQIAVSEYDLLLVVCKDGTYRILTPQDKVLLSAAVLHYELFDVSQGVEFSLVYRDKAKVAYGKKVRVLKFIRNREYRLIKDAGGQVLWLHVGDHTGKVRLDFTAAKRQRLKGKTIDFAEIAFSNSAAAKGLKLATQKVSKAKVTK